MLVLGVDQLPTLFSGAIMPEATDPEGAASLPPRTGLSQMDAGCGAGACSTCGATAVSSWLARYSAIVRSRP